ncbi:RNA 2',3'-cyclic phosphodiesterase [Paenibacillus sp.]|uniref:RNA 2',3'-cyclic phosphodiesterase n=1 Tax=Paenibacillus sp. TaxID=58172 RepID=UPI00281770EA|nr:RNA 2',3'-cyclic phosphodiesterase [Paenibacillus sp.]MDR0268341.1 RNA 2',3'-cyclic phosphodiesterase [Paenibacillus sp.]
MEKPIKDQPLRLFIAVRLPDQLKSALEQWRKDNQHLLSFKRWTHREDYHITIQFLGDVEPDRVPAIANKLQSVASQFQPFELGFDKVGIFGVKTSPQVLWAGVIDYNDTLVRLQETVTKAMEEFGFVKESRPYHPHITIARKYAGDQPFQLDSLQPLLPQTTVLRHAQMGATWTMNEFVLFSTHLHDRPMYEILDSIVMEDS